jgi:hypothetical protein
MLAYNARRIRFEDEFVLPRFTARELYKQNDLLGNNGQFGVFVSEKTPYVRELVRQAQELGLTVSGDGTAPVKGGDIREVAKGGLITVGTSKNFDVNWIKRDGYFTSKKIAPVYDIVKDWNKIEKAMKQFADQKKSVNLNDGTTVRFHSRFMVVDGKVIPYDRNKIVVEMPAMILRDLICELEVINVRVIRNY